MAARGARSRKVVEKEIDKEKTKHQRDQFTSELNHRGFDRVMSPVGSWGRRPAASNGSILSHNSSDSGSKISAKLASLALANDDQKFVDKGRKTVAPRGRKGGVPTKVLDHNADRLNSKAIKSSKSGRSLVSANGLRPSSRATVDVNLPPVNSWDKMKVWSGGSTPPKPYAGFQNDDDLWFADGNCLIFFAEETTEDDPKPMCRVHSQILEAARSVFMGNLLKYGKLVTESDNMDAISTIHDNENAAWPLGSKDPAKRENTTIPPGNVHNHISTSKPNEGGLITHEIWFRAPQHITQPEIQRRHHLATRNFIALLYGMPIVGSGFYEMISDLQNVMETYYELNPANERLNISQSIIQYLLQRQLDNPKGNAQTALGMILWAEQESVRWEAGYLEGFVHATGMMSPEVEKLKEYKLLSQTSRNKLQYAYETIQVRIMEAEERLSTFDFQELWFAAGVSNSHQAQSGYEEFRAFLVTFYSTVWGHWPPKSKDHQGRWLSRAVLNRLQEDFGTLYDYLVDRDIQWDVKEERHIQKWKMVNRKTATHGSFIAELPGLPVTQMLVAFDTNLHFEHIPHPFPLLPTGGPNKKEAPVKKGLFRRFTSRKAPDVLGPKERYQMALAFNSASNVNQLGTSFRDSKILDTFQHHEKSLSPTIVEPVYARLGRWLVLYAVLQTLSKLSVDTIGLKYHERRDYYTCPPLIGLPPWNTLAVNPNAVLEHGAITSQMREPTQRQSYCWLAPARWAQQAEAAASGGAEATDLTPTPPAYEMRSTSLAIPLNYATSTTSNLHQSRSASSLGELDSQDLVRSRSKKVIPTPAPPVTNAVGTIPISPPPQFATLAGQQREQFSYGLNSTTVQAMQQHLTVSPNFTSDGPKIPARSPDRERRRKRSSKILVQKDFEVIRGDDSGESTA